MESSSSKEQLRFLLASQNLILFGGSMVFPYYILFIKEVGASFTEFGFAYALFALSSAFVHVLAGELSDRLNKPLLLALSAWGTAFALIFFPAVTTIFQVYVLQIVMGFFNAFQKTAEKTLVADLTEKNGRGKQIGRYHAWTTLFSALAVIVAGYAIDLFTLDVIFYAGSFFMFISGFISLKIKNHRLI